MIIPPEREPLDRPMNFTVSASLEKKVEEFAQANKVKKSVALRYILSTFFSGDFGKTKDLSENIEAKA